MINVAGLCKTLLMQRLNIPNSINMNDPQGIVQYLLNSGQVNQNQVNQAMQMKNNPNILQSLGIR